MRTSDLKSFTGKSGLGSRAASSRVLTVRALADGGPGRRRKSRDSAQKF